MKNIKILDCTLRDGGRIIDCAFPDNETKDISQRLANANVDIIELGFLRDPQKVSYKGNSTFFTDVDQLSPFVDKSKSNTMYVAFIDYGMFDFDLLKPCDSLSVDGLRVGFTKADFQNDFPAVMSCMKNVKEKGYKLFMQGVNSLGYTDKELLEIVEAVNVIKPYSFGIVDTYGAMYIDDVQRIYKLIDHNMLDNICINFHSHNNFQLSFSFAQEVVKLSQGVRSIIIDSTLDGMGKCAGNLNTELIVDFLNRKHFYNYNFDAILDIIDDYMYNLKQKYTWGYTIPSVMAGIYRSHPNNVIYLTDKLRLATKEIKYIISMIDAEKRQRYDYDNIQKLYTEYNHTKVDDKETIENLSRKFNNRSLLLLMPGQSLLKYEDRINSFIQKHNPIIVSTNFVTDKGEAVNRYAFFGSFKRYKKFTEQRKMENTIVVSNITPPDENDFVLNYESLIERNNEDFDNTTVMLLNFLKKIGIQKFTIAGFDGYERERQNYYEQKTFEGERFEKRYEEITNNMVKMLKRYALFLEDKRSIQFLTPSPYEKIFCDIPD